MKQNEILKYLKQFLLVRGPSGYEDEVRECCREVFSLYSDEISVDSAGNLIAFYKGKSKEEGSALFAHMDELSWIVKRVQDDGTLKVDSVGGIFPADSGQGPVEIMAESGILPGVLSLGCVHSSSESQNVWKTMSDGGNQARQWSDMFVFTGITAKKLESLGVFPGTRVVVAQNKRYLHEVGDFWSGYFMDNRIAIVTALTVLSLFKTKKQRPKNDLYVVLSTEEEIGGIGASYACKTLPINCCVAIDVGPVADEYRTVLNADPIIAYKDRIATYTPSICEGLVSAGKRAKVKIQRAVWTRYGSDASCAKSHGNIPKAGLVCIPTQNTHGYEIVHKEGISQAAKLLYTFLA